MNQGKVQNWGDRLPSDVLQECPAPVKGVRLPDGQIKCGGCGTAVEDSRLPGLLPSCGFCWTAILVDKETGS